MTRDAAETIMYWIGFGLIGAGLSMQMGTAGILLASGFGIVVPILMDRINAG